MLDFLASVLDFFGRHSDGIQTVGFVGSALVAVCTYWRKTRLERIETERQVYREVEEIYFQIHEMTLQYPDLDVSWYRDEPDRPLSASEALQQNVLFEMITRMFESAFLVYRHSSDDFRHRQWDGWNDFIDDYLKKRSYRTWWLREDWPLKTYKAGDYSQYDRDFEKFIAEKLERIGR